MSDKRVKIPFNGVVARVVTQRNSPKLFGVEILQTQMAATALNIAMRDLNLNSQNLSRKQAKTLARRVNAEYRKNPDVF